MTQDSMDMTIEAMTGGVSAWFEAADEQGRVRIRVSRERAPSAQRWADKPERARKHLPRLLSDQTQIGFFVSCARIPEQEARLDLQNIMARSAYGDQMEDVDVTLSLAALLGLPCLQPREELREFQLFLEGIAKTVAEHLAQGRQVGPQVFRVPREKGIDWAGLGDHPDRKVLNHALTLHIQSSPVLSSWRDTQLESLRRTGRGPYRWYNMPTQFLFPRNEYYRFSQIFIEQKKSKPNTSTRKRPSP